MFRNQRLQHFIAKLLLISFYTMSITPALAQSNPNPNPNKPPALTLTTLVPLQKIGNTPTTALLPLAPPPASKDNSPGKPTVATHSSGVQNYTQALAQLKDLVKQATISPNNSVTANSAHLKRIRDQYRAVLAAEKDATTAFTRTGAHIRSQGLPAAILQRHQAAVALQTARIAELRATMATLDLAAAGRADPAQAIAQLNQFHQQFGSQTAQPPASLNLNNGINAPSRPAPVRAPQRALTSNSSANPTSPLGNLPLPPNLANQPPTAADLAESADLQFTPEIRALATSLNNNPVQIANWVRNNLRFTPGFGSMQGAATTLAAQSGNAIDSASLLIALLRAANIPARYVYGTVEVPAARLNAWLGVNHIDAAQSLMTQAGIPTQAVLTAGQKTALQFDHVWVNAWAEFGPGRGAINRSPGTWLPIDPSFKLTQNRPGLNLRNAISLNETAIFDAAKSGASCSQDAGQHLDPNALGSSFTQYADQLNTWITRQSPDIAVGQVLGQTQSVIDAPTILPASLPYATISQSSTFNTLPDNLRWQFRYSVFLDVASQAQNRPLLSLSDSFARLATQRITLSFSPASQIDADTLASFMPRPHSDNSPIQASEFAAKIPAYLIQMKAELRVNGNVVASGGNFTLGTELIAESGSFNPTQSTWSSETSITHVGDYSAIAIDAQGISPALLAAEKARIQSLQSQLANPNSLTRDDSIGNLLYHTALNYFATSDANSAIAQRAANVSEQRLPSYGRAVAQVIPHFVLGVINSVSFPGIILDIDQNRSAAAASNASNTNITAWNQQSAQRNNAWAHLVLNQHYTSSTRPGQAASAVNILSKAAVQDQPVFGVTAANINTLLPQISLNERAQLELQNAVTSGYRVIVPQSNNTQGAWTGQALLIEDSLGSPPSGRAQYRLLGENGSASAALYPDTGMPWLALAQPFQAANSILPVTQAAQNVDTTLLALLQDNRTRWQFFPAQNEVANGLFLERLASGQGSTVCDRLTSILATQRGTVGIDPGTVQNTSVPVITSAPVTAGTAGQRYQYPVSASDPGNAPLRFSLVNTTTTPSTINISSTGLVSWSQPLAGSFTITVRADNGRAFAEQTYLLSIGDQALPLELSLSVTPAIINQGENVNLTVISNGGTGSVATVVKVDGQTIALDATGRATLTGNTIGVHAIEVSARDNLNVVNQASLFSVRNPADTSPPIAIISTPLDDAEITAPVNISGSASDANLAYYQLLLRPAGQGVWREIGRGNQAVTNGTLGRLDPTQLANGIYELWLNVVDINGQQTSQIIALDIYRDLKIGQFSLSFEDLNIEASGIPIRITRTYDTRRKSDNLDFGYGWSIDYQSLQVRQNRTTGLQWKIATNPIERKLCLVPTSKHKINITLPTGKVERFTAANNPECATDQLPAINIRFTPLPGTTSQLEMVNVPHLTAQGGQIFDLDNLQTWNQLDYKLVTEDKYTYYLTEGIGITSVQDRYGNALYYGQNGILHSNGQSIIFTRDAAKRITVITDPAGKTIRYGYNAKGDLISVTDRENAVAKFNYNRSHGLLDYTDPRNVLAARYVYDEQGRVVAVYDADNHAVEMTHDTANNKETVKNGRGFSTTYTYDEAGNVIETLDALNHKTAISYDALGNETKTVNALNQTTLRSFDDKTGKQLSETDPLQNSSTWAYEGTDLKTYTDARKNPTSYGYANDGSLTVTEPLGRASTIGFDAKGNVNNLVIAGQATQSTFDARGNKLTETDALGNVTTYGYDSNNRETARSWKRIVQVNGVPVEKTFTSSRKYNANGNVIEETDAQNNTTKSEYDGTGQLTATIDAQGRVTRFDYNARGKPTKTTYPDNSTEITTYDAESNPVSKIDRQKRETKYEYDPLNRLTKTTFPDGSSNQTEYDAVGRVKATIDANNHRTVNEYDDAGRLISVTDPQQRKTSFTYDENGNRTKVTDADQNSTIYEYDALNRLTKVTYPDQKFSLTTWRANGRKQSETDTAGKTTEYGYSPTGQLTKVTQSDGRTTQITEYSYDSTGNKAKQTDAEQHSTSWEFDANNRVTSRTLPGLQQERFAYDEVGNLKQKTDFNSKATQYSYNTLQQLVLVLRPDGASVVNTYTASGQIETVTITPSASSGLVGGKTSYEYDTQDRITRQTNSDGSFLAWGYYADGSIKERSTAAGTVKYEYNANQLLSKVTDVDGKVTTYDYDTLNRLKTTITPNGIVSTRRYDINNRLVQLVHRKTDASAAIVTGVFYKLAANGQRLEMQELDSASTASATAPPTNPVRTAKYQYDDMNRLTQEQILNRSSAIVRTTNYEFDKVGNHSKKTEITAGGTETILYTYDSNDRLQQESKTTSTAPTPVITLYTWDNNGNLKSKAVAGQITFNYWDSDNRLIEVKQGASEAAAVTIAKYRYDASGNRVAKIEPGQNSQPDKVTAYLTDTTFPYAQVVQETSTQGQATESTRYVWGTSLIEQVRGGQGTFYHADGLGSTKALTDQNGDLTDSYQYEAYGNLENRTGATANGYRYTGEYFDDSTQLQYNRARWYAPTVGRFASIDPLPGEPIQPSSLNRYLYASSDPINRIDPSGLLDFAELQNVLADIGRSAKASVGNYRIIFEKSGCLLIEGIATEVITNGVYIFLDELIGLPYIGKTKNAIDKRLEQHIATYAKNGARIVGDTLAKFHVVGGKAELQIIEQLIIDLVSEGGKVSNVNRALSETRVDKKLLRERLAKIKLCK